MRNKIADLDSIPTAKEVPEVIITDHHSKIPRIMLLMWIALASYSYGVSVITDCSIFSMFLYYLAGLAGFYVWHFQAHRNYPWLPFNKECRRLHNIHHYKLYPPARFFGRRSDEVRSEPDNKMQMGEHSSFFTQHEALLYLIMLSNCVVSYICGLATMPTVIGALIMYVVMGLVGNWLHNTFHIEGHWLENFSWFEELRALHYIHHLGTCRHNYAVLNFGTLSPDKIFGSLLIQSPHKKKTKASEDEVLAKLREALSEPGALPKAINQAHVLKGLSTGTITSSTLFMGGEQSLYQQNHSTRGESLALSRGLSAVVARIIIVGMGIYFWFMAQYVISESLPTLSNEKSDIEQLFNDRGFKYLDGLRDYIWDSKLVHTCVLTMLLANEVMTIALLCIGIIGSTVRPLVSLFLCVVGRQLFNFVTVIQEPSNSPWQEAVTSYSILDNIPLLSTLHTSGDNLVSTPVMISTLFAIEGLRLLPKKMWIRAIWFIFGFALVGSVVSLVLALHISWSFSVLLALLLARYSALISVRWADDIETLLP